jgi:hypothetical protein
MSALCHKQTLGPEAFFLFRAATFPKLREDFIHVEASCLLSLWVIPERHQELTHIVLCRDAPGKPTLVMPVRKPDWPVMNEARPAVQLCSP